MQNSNRPRSMYAIAYNVCWKNNKLCFALGKIIFRRYMCTAKITQQIILQFLNCGSFLPFVIRKSFVEFFLRSEKFFVEVLTKLFKKYDFSWNGSYILCEAETNVLFLSPRWLLKNFSLCFSNLWKFHKRQAVIRKIMQNILGIVDFGKLIIPKID